ncbi:PucR family transcriptional regulator [Rhodococcus wratislaviensis]|uniref:Putative CdaR family transcriptional regulator n=1 Tax=Rhodococcus wratislaviensis NBRC 100605 TaxID=1219028 RepID=X0R971_RHOWR|nr:helix-turn-helix domain-containing protein [Rhodococcus wratislaviensis]GAF47525.1 putative CdaR family transcriptional regulator [Rhodococcus wratislaviensis NBRC 100605]
MLEELQRIAEDLAVRLGRSIAIDDPQIRLLVHTAHGDAALDRIRMTSITQRRIPAADEGFEYLNGFGISKAIDPVRIPADQAGETISRVCVPIRFQGLLFGYLWLLDPDESMGDDELDLAMESANSAGEVLFRARLMADRHEAAGQEILRDLLSSNHALAQGAADRLTAARLMGRGSQVVALVLGIESTGDADLSTSLAVALRKASQQASPWQSVWAVEGSASGVLLLGSRNPPIAHDLEKVGLRLQRAAAEALPDLEIHVGIGPAAPSVEQAYRSYRYAKDAMRVAAIVPGFGAVVSWESLGIYRTLIQLPPEALTDVAIPNGLRRLIEVDGSGVMLETLETYLDEAGSLPASIRRLNIHRTTLYYRLQRIEEATAMSLRDGSDRLALHLGAKIIRLTGAVERR